MYTYTFTQWIMFFYIYCFLGWCFESTYVSIKKRKFINRGFMKGPFLPLYGCGAITVLWTALPFKESPVSVYFVGALAATLLEYLTGVCMEALFKVRYWDYTGKKFQFQGHICLGSSTAWGMISMALIYVLHTLVEGMVLQFPENWTMYIVFLLTVGIAGDFATSFKTAMDIRQVLAKLEVLKEDTRHLQKRILLMEQQVVLKVTETKDKQTQSLEDLLSDIKERLETLQFSDFTDKLQQYKEELLDIRSGYITVRERIKESFAKANLQMLRRNPTAVSEKHKELLEEYRQKLEQKAEELKNKKD